MTLANNKISLTLFQQLISLRVGELSEETAFLYERSDRYSKVHESDKCYPAPEGVHDLLIHVELL